MLPVNVGSVKVLIIQSNYDRRRRHMCWPTMLHRSQNYLVFSTFWTRFLPIIYPWLYFCFNSSEKSHNKKNVNTIFSIQLTNSVVSSLLLKYSGITYKYSEKSAILMNKLLGVCSFALVFQVENYQACFVDASLARRLLVFSCR